MPKIQRPCEECGTQTESWPSQSRRFCSKACQRSWRVRTAAPPKKPRTGRYEPCRVCGADVWRRQHQIREGTGRFCSKACFDQSQRKARIACVCECCGKDFSLKPSQAEFQTGRFCSKRCDGIARIRRPLDRSHNGKPARQDDAGYVWVWEPGHPEAARYKGWISEHRLVAESIIGRILTSTDEVHHINRDKVDNRPENLEVLDGVTHARLTANQRLSDAQLLAAYIERFGPLD